MTRRIMLPLAADTTDTECGACVMLARKSPGMGYAPVMRCVLFRADRTADISAFAYDERLPRPAECLSAEREAVELQERAERAESEVDRLRAALSLSEVDVALDRSWCRICRTEGRGDHRGRDVHPHANGCALARLDAAQATTGRPLCQACHQRPVGGSKSGKRCAWCAEYGAPLTGPPDAGPCEKCRGRGSFHIPFSYGQEMRCHDCNGTGKAKEVVR